MAVRDNRDFFVHIEETTNSIRIYTKDGTDTNKANAEVWQGGDTINIAGVKFPIESNTTASVILFRKSGISDPAIIHLAEGGRQVSLRIEPFLPDIIIIPGHLEYSDCD